MRLTFWAICHGYSFCYMSPCFYSLPSQNLQRFSWSADGLCDTSSKSNLDNVTSSQVRSLQILWGSKRRCGCDGKTDYITLKQVTSPKISTFSAPRNGFSFFKFSLHVFLVLSSTLDKTVFSAHQMTKLTECLLTFIPSVSCHKSPIDKYGKCIIRDRSKAAQQLVGVIRVLGRIRGSINA